MTHIPSYKDLKPNKIYCSYHRSRHSVKFLRVFKVTGQQHINEVDECETIIPVYEYTEIVSRKGHLQFDFGYNEAYYIDNSKEEEEHTCYWELNDDEIYRHVMLETV